MKRDSNRLSHSFEIVTVLVVSVSATGPGIEKDKFLGDTKVDEGTGIQVGTAVSLLVLAWKLGKCGDGLSYYTCTVNTSRDRGLLKKNISSDNCKGGEKNLD